MNSNDDTLIEYYCVIPKCHRNVVEYRSTCEGPHGLCTEHRQTGSATLERTLGLVAR